MNNGPFAAFEKLGVSLTAATRRDLDIIDAEILDPREPAHAADTCPECGGEGVIAIQWNNDPDRDDVEECPTCIQRRLDAPCEACGVTPNGRGCLCDDGGDA